MRSTPKCDIMRAYGYGDLCMKTKIIYISGNELFEIADIRSAFDEVRAALSLGPDTVLFGVPVDKDDALAASVPLETAEPAPKAVIDITPEIPEPVEVPEEKVIPHRTTRKSAKIIQIHEPEDNKSDESDKTVSEPKDKEPSAPTDEQPDVPPILSVLGSESNADDVPDLSDEQPKNVETVDDDNVETESVTIQDMIADEAPTEEHEKTLEELLESMAPLGEDAEKPEAPVQDTDIDENVEPDSDAKSENDIDITLEKLATEFVENQDKIGIPDKPATRGKIGKLKNILPFKKAKHDDSSLMGDLFGWAGVAANDEDFTIPGFFK